MTALLPVRAIAPGKVNLTLRVGPVRPDGYHPLVTVFQAVSLYEEIQVSAAPPGSGIAVQVSGPHAAGVPHDSTNLAWRAAQAIANHQGLAPDILIHIHKGIPVAGGMAGGSADAAATLIACQEFWQASLDDAERHRIARQLGADVPFAILGGTAQGLDRGDALTPLGGRHSFHWVFAVSDQGLPTAQVFQAFDAAGHGSVLDHEADAALIRALTEGDAAKVGALLHNDLQPIATQLRPDLHHTMEVARRAGALGVVLSGSGPTIAALAADHAQALAIAAAWAHAPNIAATYTATGPVPGTQTIPPHR